MSNHELFSGKAARPRRLTWLTMPISLLLHALVIVSLVVVPLIRADAGLPATKVFSVQITAPPLPLPPGKGSGEKNTDRTKGPQGKDTAGDKGRVNDHTRFGKLIVPIEVPETIQEEDPGNIGIGSGPVDGGGGIIDGFEGGDPNALIGDDTTEIVNESQPAYRVPSVQMPRKIREISPVYSAIAIAANIQGRVVIEATTDIYGRVRSARIISSASPLLNDSALSAIKQWLYEPYVVNGIPKPVVFTVTITFTLEK